MANPIAGGNRSMRSTRWPKALGSVVVTVAGSGVLFVANACSLLSKTSADQCKSTDDCRALGPDFANAVCGDDHICGINPLVSCTTNKQCLDAFRGQPYTCR